MRYKIFSYLLIGISLTFIVIPIIDYYQVSYHELQSDTYQMEDETTLSYQLGYTNDQKLYLLLWKDSGNITLDILWSEYITSAYFKHAIDKDVIVPDNGLRIILPTPEGDNRIEIRIGIIEALSENLPNNETNYYTYSVIDSYFYISIREAYDYTGINFSLITLISALGIVSLSFTIWWMNKKSDEDRELVTSTTSQTRKIQYNPDDKNIKAKPPIDISDGFTSSERSLFAAIIGIIVLLFLNEVFPTANFLLFLGALLLGFYGFILYLGFSIDLISRVVRNTKSSIPLYFTLPIYVFAVYHTILGWKSHLGQLQFVGSLSYLNIWVIILVIMGLLTTIAYSFDEEAFEINKYRFTRCAVGLFVFPFIIQIVVFVIRTIIGSEI